MPTIAFDLDGTIAHWDGDKGYRCGEWVEGAQGVITRLSMDGHACLVHTCRADWALGGGVPEVARFLITGEFEPFIVINAPIESGHQMANWTPYRSAPDRRLLGVGIWIGTGKPLAHVYVDDRGVHFDEREGWESAEAEIRARLATH